MKKQKRLSLALLVGTLCVVLLGAVVVLPAMTQMSGETMRLRGEVISSGPPANAVIPWSGSCYGTWTSEDPPPASEVMLTIQMDSCISDFASACSAIGPWVQWDVFPRTRDSILAYASYWLFMFPIPNYHAVTLNQVGFCNYKDGYVPSSPSSMPTMPATNGIIP